MLSYNHSSHHKEASLNSNEIQSNAQKISSNRIRRTNLYDLLDNNKEHSSVDNNKREEFCDDLNQENDSNNNMLSKQSEYEFDTNLFSLTSDHKQEKENPFEQKNASSDDLDDFDVDNLS